MEMPELKKTLPVGYGWFLKHTQVWLLVCAECRKKVRGMGTPDADLYETKGDAVCDLCNQALD